MSDSPPLFVKVSSVEVDVEVPLDENCEKRQKRLKSHDLSDFENNASSPEDVPDPDSLNDVQGECEAKETSDLPVTPKRTRNNVKCYVESDDDNEVCIKQKQSARKRHKYSSDDEYNPESEKEVDEDLLIDVAESGMGSPRKRNLKKRGRKPRMCSFTPENDEVSNEMPCVSVKVTDIQTVPVHDDGDIENNLSTCLIQASDKENGGFKGMSPNHSPDKTKLKSPRIVKIVGETTVSKVTPTSEMNKAFEQFCQEQQSPADETKIKRKGRVNKPLLLNSEIEKKINNSSITIKKLDNKSIHSGITIKEVRNVTVEKFVDSQPTTSQKYVQTVSPVDERVVTCVELSQEQKDNASSFLLEILKTTSELGELIGQKASDFMTKKVNSENVKDTMKLDYCVNKAFLLFKLARDNINNVEETLKQQYDNFMDTNNLKYTFENNNEIKLTPTKNINYESNDSDCEIVGVCPSSAVSRLSKEISISIKSGKSAKKCASISDTSNFMASSSKSQDDSIINRHVVWINNSNMVEKVDNEAENNQSFLEQDSRILKPPDKKNEELTIWQKHFLENDSCNMKPIYSKPSPIATCNCLKYRFKFGEIGQRNYNLYTESKLKNCNMLPLCVFTNLDWLDLSYNVANIQQVMPLFCCKSLKSPHSVSSVHSEEVEDDGFWESEVEDDHSINCINPHPRDIKNSSSHSKFDVANWKSFGNQPQSPKTLLQLVLDKLHKYIFNPNKPNFSDEAMRIAINRSFNNKFNIDKWVYKLNVLPSPETLFRITLRNINSHILQQKLKCCSNTDSKAKINDTFNPLAISTVIKTFEPMTLHKLALEILNSIENDSVIKSTPTVVMSCVKTYIPNSLQELALKILNINAVVVKHTDPKKSKKLVQNSVSELETESIILYNKPKTLFNLALVVINQYRNYNERSSECIIVNSLLHLSLDVVNKLTILQMEAINETYFRKYNIDVNHPQTLKQITLKYIVDNSTILTKLALLPKTFNSVNEKDTYLSKYIQNESQPSSIILDYDDLSNGFSESGDYVDAGNWLISDVEPANEDTNCMIDTITQQDCHSASKTKQTNKRISNKNHVHKNKGKNNSIENRLFKNEKLHRIDQLHDRDLSPENDRLQIKIGSISGNVTFPNEENAVPDLASSSYPVVSSVNKSIIINSDSITSRNLENVIVKLEVDEDVLNELPSNDNELITDEIHSSGPEPFKMEPHVHYIAEIKHEAEDVNAQFDPIDNYLPMAKVETVFGIGQNENTEENILGFNSENNGDNLICMPIIHVKMEGLRNEFSNSLADPTRDCEDLLEIRNRRKNSGKTKNLRKDMTISINNTDNLLQIRSNVTSNDTSKNLTSKKNSLQNNSTQEAINNELLIPQNEKKGLKKKRKELLTENTLSEKPPDKPVSSENLTVSALPGSDDDGPDSPRYQFPDQVQAELCESPEHSVNTESLLSHSDSDRDGSPVRYFFPDQITQLPPYSTSEKVSSPRYTFPNEVVQSPTHSISQKVSSPRYTFPNEVIQSPTHSTSEKVDSPRYTFPNEVIKSPSDISPEKLGSPRYAFPDENHMSPDTFGDENLTSPGYSDKESSPIKYKFPDSTDGSQIIRRNSRALRSKKLIPDDETKLENLSESEVNSKPSNELVTDLLRPREQESDESTGYTCKIIEKENENDILNKKRRNVIKISFKNLFKFPNKSISTESESKQDEIKCEDVKFKSAESKNIKNITKERKVLRCADLPKDNICPLPDEMPNDNIADLPNDDKVGDLSSDKGDYLMDGLPNDNIEEKPNDNFEGDHSQKDLREILYDLLRSSSEDECHNETNLEIVKKNNVRRKEKTNNKLLKKFKLKYGNTGINKDGWMTFSVQPNDVKVFSPCLVLINKLPDIILEMYRGYLDDRAEEREIENLLNFSNLQTRRREDSRSASDHEKVEVTPDYFSYTFDIPKKTKKQRVHTHIKFKDKIPNLRLDDESETDSEIEAYRRYEKTEALKRRSARENERKNLQAKEALLASSSDEFTLETLKQKHKRKSKKSKDGDTNNSNEGNKIPKEKRKWVKNQLLIGRLSETDSSEEERRWLKRKERERLGEVLPQESSSKRKSAKSSRRRAIRIGGDMEVYSSDENEPSSNKNVQNIDFEETIDRLLGAKDSQKVDTTESKDIKPIIHEKSPKGRKNIRKLIDKNSLAESTKLAVRNEEERKHRLFSRNKFRDALHNTDEIILDIDIQTKKPVLTLHPSWKTLLKEHQVEGLKFMWDACFESVERSKSGDKGGGCILAHCMGLGKTLQVIALFHTVLTNASLGIRCILVCCPLSTVLNWVDELTKWLKAIGQPKAFKVFELSKLKKNYERGFQLEDWHKEGGVFVIGYEMFRHLTSMTPEKDKVRPLIIKKITTTLLSPGPDMVVCDEGHLLKNENTALARTINRIETKRRIALTGTPLQNNLREYYCMVNFVKPNLLGTYREYFNRFENPIINGQHRDSSGYDIRIMKHRSHVLHKMLDCVLQRKEVSILYPYLPKKHEYVLLISLTNCQVSLYQFYLTFMSSRNVVKKSILKDYHNLQRIWTHPRVMHYFHLKSKESSSQKKANKAGIKLEIKEEIGLEDELAQQDAVAHDADDSSGTAWWSQFLAEEDLQAIDLSNKFSIAFNIIDECVAAGDKILLFSMSLFTLDTLEYFLQKMRNWSMGTDYYRLDGSVPLENRQKWCREFNNESNIEAKLFLISTRAGGLGINMIAANRVIIMDASWNPSHDMQSIFRVYRFGQVKECFVYRLIAMGTMEEKIYERSVTKQAIALRVVDEQQIDRHYNMAELNELYNFTPPEPYSEKELESLPVPSDPLLARLLVQRMGRGTGALRSYHEHDSLLQHVLHEGLDEDEQKKAWDDYKAEQASKEAAEALRAANAANAAAFAAYRNTSEFSQYLATLTADSAAAFQPQYQTPTSTPYSTAMMSFGTPTLLTDSKLKNVLMSHGNQITVPNNLSNRSTPEIRPMFTIPDTIDMGNLDTLRQTIVPEVPMNVFAKVYRQIRISDPELSSEAVLLEVGRILSMWDPKCETPEVSSTSQTPKDCGNSANDGKKTSPKKKGRPIKRARGRKAKSKKTKTNVTEESLLPDHVESVLPDDVETLLPDKVEMLLPDNPESVLPDNEESVLPDCGMPSLVRNLKMYDSITDMYTPVKPPSRLDPDIVEMLPLFDSDCEGEHLLPHSPDSDPTYTPARNLKGKRKTPKKNKKKEAPLRKSVAMKLIQSSITNEPLTPGSNPPVPNISHLGHFPVGDHSYSSSFVDDSIPVIEID